MVPTRQALSAPPASAGRNVRAIAFACFAVSGAAGLLYEICWIRRASLAFGSTVFAASTVLAVFFLGLALGSRVFGGIASRTTRPLRLYAGLELALAALALLTLPAFGWAESAYGTLYRGTSLEAARLGGRFALMTLVLLPPAFLMGGTLPLLCRQFVSRPGRIGADVGLLYGIHTLGAAAGCALAGLWAIPALGLARTMALGAAASAAAGIVAGLLRVSAPPLGPARPEPGRSAVAGSSLAGIVFLGGFAALGFEVLWTRFLALVVRQTVTTYTLALAVVLVGIVIGSLLATRLADRTAGRAVWLGLLAAGAGLAPLLLMLQPPALWRDLGGDLAVTFALLLPAAALSGAAFPLAVRAASADPAGTPGAVGRLLAWNTLGGIAGSLAAGFVLLPRVGMQGALVTLSAASLAAAALAWLTLDGGRPGRLRIALAALAVLVWWAAPRFLTTRIPADFLAAPAELVSWREGRQSELAVVRRNGIQVLELDRWWQGQDARTHQIVAAHLPLRIHPGAARVLVVGAGAGQTPARVLHHDPERLDVADLEPAVFGLIRSHFESSWMDDPRVRLIPEDGRDLVAHTAERWDVISIEVGQIFRPGVGAFYTTEFYRDARERLAPLGLISQFVPLAFLTPETFRSVLATFRGVFPECALWYNTSELLLIGARDSLAIRTQRLEPGALPPAAREDLHYAYWGGPLWTLDRPGVLAGGFLCGPRGVAALAAGGALLTDDRPVLEYTARAADAQALHEIPLAALLLAQLDSLPAGVPRFASQVRARNLSDLAAGAWLRRAESARERGDDPGTILAAGEALRANSENLDARRLSGDALLRVGRLVEAEAAFRELIARDSSDAGAYRALAMSLHRRGTPAAAIPWYEAALRHDPRDAEAHNNLGAALAEGGALAAALAHFERALELRPGYAEARDNVTRVRAALAARR